MTNDDAYARGVADTLALVEVVASIPVALVTLRSSAAITRQRLAEAVAHVDMSTLRVLRPFDPREALSVKEAAGAAGVSPSAVRAWCRQYAIGRHRVGALLVSAPALAMLVEDDLPALVAYLCGDRGPVVAPYFARVPP